MRYFKSRDELEIQELFKLVFGKEMGKTESKNHWAWEYENNPDGKGEVLFFGLYFFMTGLHALHIIVGVVFIAFVFNYVIKDKVTHDNFVLLENAGLYWHLVDIIWIFLFPLFYLIT